MSEIECYLKFKNKVEKENSHEEARFYCFMSFSDYRI